MQKQLASQKLDLVRKEILLDIVGVASLIPVEIAVR